MEEAQYIHGPGDSGRINLSDEHEMHYWTRLLGVSELRLLVAVAFAGVMASDVRAYLGFQSAQPAAASHGLGASEYPDFYSAEEPPRLMSTSVAREPRTDKRAPAFFTRFSHAFGSARRKPDG